MDGTEGGHTAFCLLLDLGVAVFRGKTWTLRRFSRDASVGVDSVVSGPVQVRDISESDAFQNTIMFFIGINVLIMCLDKSDGLFRKSSGKTDARMTHSGSDR